MEAVERVEQGEDADRNSNNIIRSSSCERVLRGDRNGFDYGRKKNRKEFGCIHWSPDDFMKI